MTVINRRNFLGMLSVAAGTAVNLRLWAKGHPQHYLLAAAESAKGQFSLFLMDSSGQTHWQHDLPARAHQTLVHPTKPWAVVVARRPGQFIDVVNLHDGLLYHRIAASPEQDFCGHARFSPDGRYLLTTENRLPSCEGRLVVRDSHAGFEVVADFPSGGLGPHELLVDETRRQVIIANGGIKTAAREKLNLASMQPSLSFIDLHSGDLLHQQFLPAQMHQASIRHISQNQAGMVLMAMQYEGEAFTRSTLVAVTRAGGEIQPLPIPEEEFAAIKQYCGSACMHRQGNIGAVSAPRGDRILFFNVTARQFIRSVRISDGCGLASASQRGEFFVSSGRGRLYRVSALDGSRTRLDNQSATSLRWDNHLASLPV